MKSLFLYFLKDPAVSDEPLAGRTAMQWLICGAGDTPYRVIDEEGAATPLGEYDYTAILYGNTPLVTASDLRALIREMDKREIEGMEIGRGRLVKTRALREGRPPKRRCAEPFARTIENRADRAAAERILYRKNAEISAQNGAIIADPNSVRIDACSLVEEGAIIEPYAAVTRSRVRRNARIGAFSEITDAEIGEGAFVRRSVVENSVVGAGATVGPFAYIRMGSEIGAGCRVGDFVEIKKSRLDEGVKAAHLTYIGDATVGRNTNVGCGTVFANYDGREKHATRVGQGVFIGANTNLVAPIEVGDGAYIAAATTVTKDVPSGAFVIGRVREEQKKRE